MSPLYGAPFLWLIGAILWWSGWRKETADDLPEWAVGIFLAVWPLAFLGRFSGARELGMSAAWAWTLLAAIVLGWRMPPARRWTAASAGLLVGSVSIFIGRLAQMPDDLAHGLSPAVVSIVAGAIAAILLSSASEQTLAISISLALSAAAFAIAHVGPNAPAGMREAQWLESWWISVLFARLWTVAGLRISGQARKWAYKLGEKRGGQRS